MSECIGGKSILNESFDTALQVSLCGSNGERKRMMYVVPEGHIFSVCALLVLSCESLVSGDSCVMYTSGFGWF